jgi:hypothetical protein
MTMYEMIPAMRPYAMEYVNGITARVMKAGKESPQYFQLISLAALHIMAPTMTNVHPVAHGGIDAKIGAKKMEIKKQIPVVMAVMPVFPPSEIPAPDSMNAVTGESPKREPIEIPKAKWWVS